MIYTVLIDDDTLEIDDLTEQLKKHFPDIHKNLELIHITSCEIAQSASQTLLEKWDALKDDDTLVVLMDFYFESNNSEEDYLPYTGGDIVNACVEAGIPQEVFLGISSAFKHWEGPAKIQKLPRADIYNMKPNCQTVFDSLKSKGSLL